MPGRHEGQMARGAYSVAKNYTFDAKELGLLAGEVDLQNKSLDDVAAAGSTPTRTSGRLGRSDRSDWKNETRPLIGRASNFDVPEGRSNDGWRLNKVPNAAGRGCPSR